MKKALSVLLSCCLLLTLGLPMAGLAAEEESSLLTSDLVGNEMLETESEVPEATAEEDLELVEETAEPEEELEELVDNSAQSTMAPEETIEPRLLNELELLQNGDFPDPTLEVETFADYSEAQAYLHQEMLKLSPKIQLEKYQIPKAELSGLMQDLINHNPDLFILDRQAWYRYYSSGGIVTSMLVNYIDQAEAKLTEYQEMVDGIVNNLLEQMENNLNNREKILLVQNYLVSNYQYDYSYSIYDAYNFFAQKTGVCQAYTLATMELLNRLAIPASYVISTEDNHAWNAVQVGDKWYHLDVTHSDPVYENGRDFKGRVTYDHYLVSSEQLHSVCDLHDNFKSKYVMDDSTYDDYFWKDVAQSFAYSGENWYYALYDMKSRLTNIYQWEPTDNQSTFEKSLNFKWNHWTIGSSYWPGFYSGLNYYKGSLLYNDSQNIYSYDLATKQQEQLLSVDTSEGYIYGFALDGDILSYQLAQDPIDYEAVYQISLARPVTGISLNKTALALEKGKQETLIASLDPTNADDQTIIWSSNNPKIATVDNNGQVRAVAVGKANITATTADGGFTAACVVTVTAPIVKVTGIKLNYTALKLYPGITKQLLTTIAPSDASNQSLIWRTNNSNVATVNSQGLVTTKAPGSATVTVKTADGGFIATCKITVVKKVTGVNLNLTSLTLNRGSSKQLTATIVPSDAYNQKLTWTSSNLRVATVDNQGLVKGVASGKATITVKTADGGFTAACQVTVGTVAKKVIGVKLNYAALKLYPGVTKQLLATIAPSDAYNKNLIWRTNNSNVATVSSQGLVTTKAPGSASITVKTADGGFIATCRVTVVKRVTGVNLNLTTLTLDKGASKQLMATVAPSDAYNQKLTWTSSNLKVATVDSQGLVKGVAPGTAVIRVKTTDGGFIAACQVNVGKKATGVKLNYAALKLYPGVSKQLLATIAPSDAYNKNLIWRTNNSNVATVNSQGLVTTKAPGIATITVKTVDGGFAATCKITVVKKVTGVNLNLTSLTLNIGASKQIAATAAPSDAYNKKLTWTSSNLRVATVDSQGLIKGVASGSTVITVKTVDGGFTATCQVTVIK